MTHPTLLPRRVGPALALLGLALAARPAAGTYTYTIISDPNATGGNFYGTFAAGINASGQIVGTYENASGFFGFVDTGGKYTTIPGPGGASAGGSQASGINDAGRIAGTYSDNGTPNGFVYIPRLDGGPGNYAIISDPQATGGTIASGINNGGQVVGYYANGGFFGFEKTGSTYTTLSVPGAEAGTTQAFGINNDGQVVGEFAPSSGVGEGFIYSGGASGTYIDLQDPNATSAPGNAIITAAYGINDAGQVVGTYTTGALSGQAFLL